MERQDSALLKSRVTSHKQFAIAVRDLRALPGKDIRVITSGTRLFRDPGATSTLEKRLFRDPGHTSTLELVASETTGRGVLILTYRSAQPNATA
ncbi:hypothetical protein BH18CHL1_BH18CHL1_00570 [soil metagenome]